MERLMALYNTASPSGREKSMIRLLKAELTEWASRITRTGKETSMP